MSMCLTVVDGVEHSAEGAGGWRTRSGRLVLGGSYSFLRETLCNHIHSGSRMTGAVAGDLSVKLGPAACAWNAGSQGFPCAQGSKGRTALWTAGLLKPGAQKGRLTTRSPRTGDLSGVTACSRVRRLGQRIMKAGDSLIRSRPQPSPVRQSPA